jgi:hypothetical protein
MEDNIEEEKTQGPWKFFISIILLFIIVLFVFPQGAIKINPSPSNIPELNELNLTLNTNYTSYSTLYEALQPNDPQLRDISNYIIVKSCQDSNKICHAKALYLFVRENIIYTSDPINSEYFEHPLQVLSTGGGDCESGSILLLSMMQSIGIYGEFVFNPGHAFIKISLPDAPKSVRQNGDFVYLDWTCNSCKFGDLPKNALI